jgi:hypothetical protein
MVGDAFSLVGGFFFSARTSARMVLTKRYVHPQEQTIRAAMERV